MPKYFPVSGEISGYQAECETQAITIGGFTLENTRIHNNSARSGRDPACRVHIRNVSIRRCQHWANYAEGVVFEDVQIHDVRGGGAAPLLLRACVFQNVRVSGNFGGIYFKLAFGDDERTDRAYLSDNSKRYEGIELALHIAEADWTSFDMLIGVPSRLVVRDPTRHFIMRREHASAIACRPDVGAWRIAARDLLRSELNDAVVVPGPRETEREAARTLHSAGLIE